MRYDKKIGLTTSLHGCMISL